MSRAFVAATDGGLAYAETGSDPSKQFEASIDASNLAAVTSISSSQYVFVFTTAPKKITLSDFLASLSASLTLNYDGSNSAALTVNASGDLSIVPTSGVLRIPDAIAGGSSGAAGTPASNELLWGGPVQIAAGSVDALDITSSKTGTGSFAVRIPNGAWYAAKDSSGNNIRLFSLSASNDVYMGAVDNAGGSVFIREDGATIITIAGGLVGVGTTPSTAKLHVLSTTEQFRLGYDASNYCSWTVSSGGDLTVAPSGEDMTINANLAVLSAAGASNTITDNSSTATNQALLVLSNGNTGANPKKAIGLTFSTPRVGWFGGTARIVSGNETSTNSPKTFLAFYCRDDSSGNPTNEKMRITAYGAVGINITSPSAKLHVIETTEQLRLGYNTSNYASHTVSSGGILTITPSGGKSTFTGDLEYTGRELSSYDTQALVAGTTINSHVQKIFVTSVADITMAGSPIIANGTKTGQELLIVNVEAHTITIPHGGNVVCSGGTNKAIGPAQTIRFLWNHDYGGGYSYNDKWFQVTPVT